MGCFFFPFLFLSWEVWLGSDVEQISLKSVDVFFLGHMPSGVVGERESPSVGSGWFCFYNVQTPKGAWMRWSSVSPLSPAGGLGWHHLFGGLHEGKKMGKDPSASVVPLVSKGHWPVWNAPLPWIRCRPGLFPKTGVTGRKIGPSWERSSGSSCSPQCPPCPAGLALICGEHFNVSGGCCARFPASETDTLQHREKK